jgi:ribosome small subunit-dependent GTPase A
MKQVAGLVMATAAKGVWVQTPAGVTEFFVFQGKHLRQPTYPCALGDQVQVDFQNRCVLGILPRTNLITRLRREKNQQLIAANVSVAWVMVTFLQAQFMYPFLFRILVGLKLQQIPVQVLISKADKMNLNQVAECQALMDYLRTYLSVKSWLVNCTDKASLPFLGPPPEGQHPPALLAVMGPSGVGKSTLIQTLTGQALTSSEVNRKTGKGKHATTQPQLYPWNGSYLADCPGIKSFAFDVGVDIGSCFEDLVAMARGELILSDSEVLAFFADPGQGKLSEYWAKKHPQNFQETIAKSRYLVLRGLLAGDA